MPNRYSLSPAQLYHWGLTKSGEYAPDINIVVALFFPHCDDPRWLGERLAAAIGRHAILRTIYLTEDGLNLQELCDNCVVPQRQVVAPPDAVIDTPDDDLPTDYAEWFRQRSVSRSAAHAVAAEYRSEKAYRYDLTAEPPSRVTVLSEIGGGASAVLGFHHAAIDAHALGVLIGEIRAAWSDADYTPVPDSRYFDYAGRKASIYQLRYDRQIQYWLALLGAARKESEESLLDRQATQCRLVGRSILIDDARASAAGGAASQSQLPHVVALGHGLGAAGLGNSTHILGTTANRAGPDERDMIGCFYKHLIWNVSDTAGADPASSVRKLSIQALRSYQNIDVSLADILREYRNRFTRYPALNAQITFRDMRGWQNSPEDNGQIEVVPFLSNGFQDRMPMHLHVSIERDQLSANLTFDPDFINEATAERVLDEFCAFHGQREWRAAG